MTSSIDVTKPEAGAATTQSVRDNFQAAKDEIEALQTDPSITGNLTLTDTNGGMNAGPILSLTRNSSSPSIGDVLGSLYFWGKNTAAEDILYGFIFAQTIVTGDGGETGRLGLGVTSGGASTTALEIETGGLVQVNNNLNIDGSLQLSGISVTASAFDLNRLDGVTATTAEINHLSGVTSAIQTQLNGKVSAASPDLTGVITLDDDFTIGYNGAVVEFTAASFASEFHFITNGNTDLIIDGNNNVEIPALNGLQVTNNAITGAITGGAWPSFSNGGFSFPGQKTGLYLDPSQNLRLWYDSGVGDAQRILIGGANTDVGIEVYNSWTGGGATFENGIVMVNLPTSDPGNTGQLWVDTAAGRVLKVSA